MTTKVENKEESSDANAGLAILLTFVLAMLLFPEHIIGPAFEAIIVLGKVFGFM